MSRATNDERIELLRTKMGLIVDEDKTYLEFTDLHRQYTLVWWNGPVIVLGLSFLALPMDLGGLTVLSSVTIFMALISRWQYRKRIRTERVTLKLLSSRLL
jgi:hypothetical protein